MRAGGTGGLADAVAEVADVAVGVGEVGFFLTFLPLSMGDGRRLDTEENAATDRSSSTTFTPASRRSCPCPSPTSPSPSPSPEEEVCVGATRVSGVKGMTTVERDREPSEAVLTADVAADAGATDAGLVEWVEGSEDGDAGIGIGATSPPLAPTGEATTFTPLPLSILVAAAEGAVIKGAFTFTDGL